MKQLTDFLNKLRGAADSDLSFPLEKRQEQLSTLYLFFIFILCFVKLQPYPLPQLDDLPHAGVALSILQTGDWFTMHHGTALNWWKPPLHFWIQAAFFKLFGVTEYWTRFPTAVTGFLTFLLAFKTARRLFGPRTAFFTLFVLSTSLFFLRFTQRSMMDMPAAFALALGVYAAVLAAKSSPKYFLLFGLSIALGYHFKGLQGLYPLAVIPLYLLASGRWAELFNRWFLAALALGFGLIAAWVVPQYLMHGNEFLNSLSGIGPLLDNGIPGRENPFYRPTKELFRMFYWSAFSFYGMWLVLKDSRTPEGREAAAALFPWFWVVMAALSVSGAFGVRYLIPALVPAGIFAAVALNKLVKPGFYRYFQHFAVILFGLAVLFVALLPVPPAKEPSKYISLFQTVRTIAEPGDRVVSYKDQSYIFNDGLVFYSSRELDRQVFSTEELMAEPIPPQRKTVVIVIPKYYSETESLIRQKRLLRLAADKNWTLFQLLPKN